MSELNQDSIFYKKIETNSTICTNCYRKLKEYTEPPSYVSDAVSAFVDYENHVNHYWVDDRHDTGRPSIKRSSCECGDMDGAKLRPLDNQQIMNIAQRILSHLEEMEYEVEEDVYFSYIRDSREGSDIHFNEEKYFEEAIDESLITEDE